jgi:FMN phosphatase YigB (HAD superfamily)
MLNQFKNSKSIGFDLDGTLYPSTPEVEDRVRNKIALKLLEKRPDLKDLDNARKFFEERYLIICSGKGVLKEVGYENSSKIMEECLINADVLDLIVPNPNLADIMKRLSEVYETYLLTSSPENSALSKLEKIGISFDSFRFMVFNDTPSSGSKSNGEAFDYAIKKSIYSPSQHIYVGDRLKQDINPAKLKGMKTIAVWSYIPESDYSINKIEEIERLL